MDLGLQILNLLLNFSLLILVLLFILRLISLFLFVSLFLIASLLTLMLSFIVVHLLPVFQSVLHHVTPLLDV